MMLRTLKWLSIAGVLAVLIFIAIFHIGAQMSLDRDYTHSHAVAALPLYSAQTTEGLVRIPARGYEFRARIAGFGPSKEAQKRPAVILLHGFPVTSAMWSSLIGPLQDAGYRVVAVDQRGYSPGARPLDVAQYTTIQLSKDVIAVANTLGLKKFHLVGHDWGAVVGWTTVMRRPNRVLSWTGLSIAHPAAFAAALENDPDQKARSRYFRLFVTPWLPETLLGFDDFKRLRGAWSTMPELQQQEYLDVFSEPGALTAALNWYRAMTISQPEAEELALDITTPTLFIWGNTDGSVARYGVQAQARYMTGPYREIELDAGHWLLTDKPEQVLQPILLHLAENSR